MYVACLVFHYVVAVFMCFHNVFERHTNDTKHKMHAHKYTNTLVKVLIFSIILWHYRYIFNNAIVTPFSRAWCHRWKLHARWWSCLLLYSKHTLCWNVRHSHLIWAATLKMIILSCIFPLLFYFPFWNRHRRNIIIFSVCNSSHFSLFRVCDSYWNSNASNRLQFITFYIRVWIFAGTHTTTNRRTERQLGEREKKSKSTIKTMTIIIALRQVIEQRG